MNETKEVCIAYENLKKLIIYEPQMDMNAFKAHLQSHFRLSNKEIILTDTKRDAEITSVLSLKSDNEVRILISGENHDKSDDENKVPSSIQAEKDNICFNMLIGKKYYAEDLLEELNEWAEPQKFKLVYSEGPKKLKNAIKRTLSCFKKNCDYRLVFLSDENGENFEIFPKLSQKYSTHSKPSFFGLETKVFRSQA